MLASGLARSRTQVVAVIVHDVMDEYFSEIARGIEDEAYANGYVTMICNTDRDPDKEVHYLRKLRALQVDAILFTAGGVCDPGHRADLDRQLAKVEAAGGVIVRLAPSPGGRPDIGYSNRIGFSLAVDHLVELGHGTIGYLAGPAGIATSADRLLAMRQAMKRHGLALDPELIFDGGFSRPAVSAAAEFVAVRLPATAMVAANDQAAIGFVRGLARTGSTSPAPSPSSGMTTSPERFRRTPADDRARAALRPRRPRDAPGLSSSSEADRARCRSSCRSSSPCGRARNHRKRRHAWPRSPSFTPGDDK